MGDFDTISFQSVRPPKRDMVPRCASGHLLECFQTKSLDCGLGYYLVRDRVLYKRQVRSDFETSITLYGKQQFAVVETPTKRQRFTGDITFYASCRQCKPVHTGHGGVLIGHHPWTEFTARFEAGLMKSLESLSHDTPETVRQEYIYRGFEILADDDPRIKRP